MNKYILLIGLIAFGFASCDEKADYEPEMSKVVDVAGEWFVKYNQDSLGVDPFNAGYTSIITYNTSADDGKEIWLSDEGHFWDYKVKIPTNTADLSFGGDTVVSVVDGYEIKVIVKNGKITEGVLEQPSGAIADSIYFELWFEDLQGIKVGDYTTTSEDVFKVSGFRRTGFIEDDH